MSQEQAKSKIERGPPDSYLRRRRNAVGFWAFPIVVEVDPVEDDSNGNNPREDLRAGTPSHVAAAVFNVEANI